MILLKTILICSIFALNMSVSAQNTKELNPKERANINKFLKDLEGFTSAYSKIKKLYVEELIYENGLSTDQLVAKIKSIVNKNKLIIADSAGKREIKDLYKEGLNIRAVSKKAGSVVSGIKRLLNYEIIVTKNSLNVIKELNNYIWADKAGEVPSGADHSIDPLRYVETTMCGGIEILG